MTVLLAGCVLSRAGKGTPESDGSGGGAAVSNSGAGGATSSAGGGGVGTADAGGAGASAGGAGGAGIGGAGIGGAGGAGGSKSIVWSSWDVAIDGSGAQVTANGQTAIIELYQSVSLNDLNNEVAYNQFYGGTHPEGFNNVETYWGFAGGSNAYPYVGKSTVNRGDDNGEMAAPMPLGVRDLQLHPPNTDKLVVMAFVAPVAGNYTVADLAVRRVDASGNTATLRLHAPCNAGSLATLQALNNRAWVVSQQSYSAGSLSVSDRICIGVSRDGDYGWDATEIAWTITAQVR